MWNSLEIKLLCRDHGNDYEVSVSQSLHAHISFVQCNNNNKFQ